MRPSSPTPEPALVPPRVCAEPDGPAQSIEEALADLVRAGMPASARLEGRPGSGLTTALRHLAATTATRVCLQLRDVDGRVIPTPEVDASLPVVAVRAAHPRSHLDADADRGERVWRLQPWSDADCRHYLQVAHPARAAAAFELWSEPAPIPDLRGTPGLCREVLDHLAQVAGTPAGDGTDPLCALAFVLAAALGQRRAEVRQRALRSFAPDGPTLGSDLGAPLQPEIARLLRSATVRALLAGEELVRIASDGGAAPFAPRHWPEPVVAVIAHLLHADPTLVHHLLALAARRPRRSGVLLSALCAAVPGFRPPGDRWRDLGGARLCGADLRGASLRGVDLRQASLRGAALSRADLRQARLQLADLAGADLTDADLRGADLRNCDLRGARVDGAQWGDADVRGARTDSPQHLLAQRRREVRDGGAA
ncbi:MAG: pentapeptide repeat-containing protein [Planctomycetota bacterium]